MQKLTCRRGAALLGLAVNVAHRALAPGVVALDVAARVRVAQPIEPIERVALVRASA